MSGLAGLPNLQVLDLHSNQVFKSIGKILLLVFHYSLPLNRDDHDSQYCKMFLLSVFTKKMLISDVYGQSFRKTYDDVFSKLGQISGLFSVFPSRA